MEDWIKGFLIALTMVIKKGPTTSIRKHTKKLKVHETIVRTAIKQDLSPGLNSLDDAVWGVLENKTNVSSNLNIEEEKIKCLKDLFWRYANHFKGMLIQKLKKNDGYIG